MSIGGVGGQRVTRNSLRPSGPQQALKGSRDCAVGPRRSSNRDEGLTQSRACGATLRPKVACPRESGPGEQPDRETAGQGLCYFPAVDHPNEGASAIEASGGTIPSPATRFCTTLPLGRRTSSTTVAPPSTSSSSASRGADRRCGVRTSATGPRIAGVNPHAAAATPVTSPGSDPGHRLGRRPESSVTRCEYGGARRARPRSCVNLLPMTRQVRAHDLAGAAPMTRQVLPS